MRRRLLRVGSWPQAIRQPHIGAAWIRAGQLSRLRGATDWPVAPPRGPAPLLVVQHAATNGPGGDLAPAVAGIRDAKGQLLGRARPALALAPVNPDGGRDHLARLALLRHMAAEWEFDLALDLTGPLDETWEAEAAIGRLGGRLALIRLGAPYDAHPDSARWRMTRRVVAAALDAGFSGTFALCPRVSLWWLAGRPDVALLLRDGIERLARTSRSHTPAAQEHPWWSRP
jgi:hypothetical protein